MTLDEMRLLKAGDRVHIGRDNFTVNASNVGNCLVRSSGGGKSIDLRLHPSGGDRCYSEVWEFLQHGWVALDPLQTCGWGG